MIMAPKKRSKNLLSNQKGQAIFEMILFLPLLLFLYTIYYTAGNSINGSINQQKAVRGYFYTLLKGNSYLVTLKDLQENKAKNIRRTGFNGLGWAQKLDSSQRSIAPCFKFSSLLKNNSEEKCEDENRETEGSSRFIRLFTYYGVCGPTYTIDASNTNFTIEPALQAASGKESCIHGAN